MPRQSRQRIQPRPGLENLMAPLRSAGGNGIAVASSPTNANGDLNARGSVIGFNDPKVSSGWTSFLSASLGNILAAGIAARQQIEERNAQEDAEERKRLQAEEEKRQAAVKARQDVIDEVQGHALGNKLFADVNEKTRSGEWSPGQADDYLTERLKENQDSLVVMQTAGEYAKKAIMQAGINDRQLIQETQVGNYLALTRQGFADLYANYDPEKPYEYVAQRDALYNGRKALGISGQQINEIEMASLSTQIKKFATTDPLKAQTLLDLAERERPDGSPSLAASVEKGYETLDAVRDAMAADVLRESLLEKETAERTLKESTQDNYINAVMELAQLQTPEERQAWADANITGKTPEELKAVYGIHRADVVSTVENMKSRKTPEGNEQAVADWTMAVELGTAEWDDITSDKRLTPPQQARLFRAMRNATQRVELGHMQDVQLAARLLGDLQNAWPNSVYQTPWMASGEPEPGKPPVVAPEGSFYQGELLKRLRQIEPNLDPQESNRQKLEIMRDVENDILSGRLRWADSVGKTGEPVPALKLSEKVKDGGTLTPPEVKSIAKAFNEGGSARVKEAFGVDYSGLNGGEQKRIMAEAQQQKAELEALQTESFFGRVVSLLSGWKENTAMSLANQIAGVPVDLYDRSTTEDMIAQSLERERLKLEEMETELVNMKENPPRLGNLKIIMLQRDIAEQREYYDSLKATHTGATDNTEKEE